MVAFVYSSFATSVKHGESQRKVKFTENKSQWNSNVLYCGQLDGGVLFLEKNCLTYNFYDKEKLRRQHIQKKSFPHDPINSHAFRMSFVGSNSSPIALSKQITHDYCNYYLGNDKSKWVGNAKNYREVVYENLYPGIDLQILGLENSMKYNFIVSPGINTNNIQLFYEGLESISIDKKDLKIKTSVNEMQEQKPYAYQKVNGKIVEVPCEFVLKNNTISFRFPRGYNKDIELVIDPVLVFACSSGSTSDNFGMTATYDADGNLYAGGTSFNIGYPTTLGAFDTSYNGIVAFGRTDVVITKYDSSGTFLQYSTYLGGATGTEVVSSLIVNSQNELMLFGATGSSDFPTSATAYDNTFNGGGYLFFANNGTEYLSGTDLYITKFNLTGTSLLGSTYVGGTLNDGANPSATLVYNYGDYYRGEIQTDNLGNCYIASCTYSTDFPVTVGCLQPTEGGGMDGVVFKMTPDLSTMIWSTYLGGTADDGCYALTLDNLQNIYTTGGTSSTNFPITAGSLSTSYNGGITDGYITKIKNDGSIVLKSTFIGTNVYDQAFLIQLDNNQDVYIVGQTEGIMPVSAGVYSNANSKQFIWQLNNNLTTQIFTTNFGNGDGTVNISPSAFLVDTCGNIYVCGWGGNILTGSATVGMPLTSDAFQSSTDGFNFYLMVLTPDALGLLYATYFGGPLSREHVDGGTSRFDKKGIVYQGVCAGCGGNDDFPVTPGSWPGTPGNPNHNTDNNNCNMGVFKFDFQAAGVNASATISPNDTICVGDSVNFSNSSSNALNYLWDFGDGSPTNTAYSPSHAYSNPGTFSITLIAFDSSGCIFSDTSHLTIIVKPIPVIDLGNDTVLCQTPNLILDAGTSASIYTWSTGATTQTIIADTIANYWVTISNGTCSATDSIQLDQFFPPTLGVDTTLCSGQTITPDVTVSGATYLWSTGANTPTINVSTTGQYIVTINWMVCQFKDTINVTYIPYPVVNLPAVVKICPGAATIIDAGAPATAYLWSSGQTTQSIDVSTGGIYVVTVSNGQCNTLDTSLVMIIPPIAWDESISLCNAQKYTLDAGFTGASYLWSTGETTQTIDVIEAGNYWVIMNTGLCILSDTIYVSGSLGSGVLWIPNSFTPDHNGLNDKFSMIGTDITRFHMLIFNRWGQLLYETERQDLGWDGIYKGELVKQDVYIWKVEYETKCDVGVLNKKIGHVTVVR